MDIEIRLKGLLQKHGEAKQGIVAKIVRHASEHPSERISRHTVSKVYKGRSFDCTLRTLGVLCDSVGSMLKMEPQDVLRELLGTPPERFWTAVAASQNVRICLGERREPDPCGLVSTWLSRRDAAVCTQIVSHLSIVSALTRSTTRPNITVYYAPASLYALDRTSSTDSTEESTRFYKRLRADSRNASTFFIGSQRANDLVELFVADLFGCAPFRASRSAGGVPFFLRFRKATSDVESCFGSSTSSPGSRGQKGPGIAYLDEKGIWRLCPWGPGNVDSGIVLAVRDRGLNSLDVACLGLSGWATEALGRALIAEGDHYWAASGSGFRWGSKTVSVCVCRFRTARTGDNGADIQATNMQRTFLSADILSRYLSGRWGSRVPAGRADR